ncbi:MAG: hypothetical protein GX089_01865 [Fibrobacter sp.]|jgi:metal-responsive CopG/Arc/MetJ family transcriptional regulator|nr:hypothetical protein [Fibrobacter sp.]OQB71870.1 MAG: nickel responsive regulator [Deltaproteobacteria bacterium ADurb.Bin135]
MQLPSISKTESAHLVITCLIASRCLEVIAVRGKARDVERLSTSLKALVGVKHLSLSISASGEDTE